VLRAARQDNHWEGIAGPLLDQPTEPQSSAADTDIHRAAEFLTTNPPARPIPVSAVNTSASTKTSPAQAWKISDLRGLAGLESIASAWKGFEAAGSSPMQNLSWARACAETFGDRGNIRVCIASTTDGALAVVAPLIERRGILRRLEALGVAEICEPMDFLYADRDALAAVCRRILGSKTPLYFHRLPADSIAPETLRSAAKRRAWVRCTPNTPHPHIDLDASWADPAQKFNAGRRSDFRRAQRRADQLGSVTFEILCPTTATLAALLDEAIAVEARSWKLAQRSALAVQPILRSFYRCYAHAAAQEGILRLVFLRIDGRAIGMQLAVESHGRFWLLKIGHDEAYSRCSPGTLLMLHALQYAAVRGLKSIEFLGTEEDWTRNWTSQVRESVTLRSYPYNFRGATLFALDAGQWAFKRVWQRLGR
jgi:CelD/BcsL family acetyltransferase involved in cellulose biosynthesis